MDFNSTTKSAGTNFAAKKHSEASSKQNDFPALVQAQPSEANYEGPIYIPSAQKVDRPGRKQSLNVKLQSDGKILQQVQLKNFFTHYEAACAINACLSKFKLTTLAHLKQALVDYMTDQLRQGIAYRNRLLSQGKMRTEKGEKCILSFCIFRSDKYTHANLSTSNSNTLTLADYCIYFTFMMIKSLCMLKYNAISHLTYVDIYYELTNIMFRVNVLKDYSQFTEQQFQWIEEVLRENAIQLEAVSFYV